MKRALTIVLLIVLAAVLLNAVAALPPHGSPDTPAYTHVGAYYLEHGPEETGSENVVTSVILNYRGFDTNGEVTVIVTALMAVIAVLTGVRDAGNRPDTDATHVEPSVVVRFIVRVLAPFILVFAVYVILNGHVTPGGGFQGGTMLGALVIALTLVLGERESAKLIPQRPIRIIQVIAPLTFVAVGLAGLIAWGDFLSFPRDEQLRPVAEAMLVLIEAGIGIGGAVVFARVFRLMGGRS
ncbi:MAG: sodium:proton antiporter [Coriobacteriia bacterium]|nr:sodium:proton antiporter [Coriobacteriia bacterium]MBN2839461.1 sodium:proton antiporter [Coriobacteriia bacterium]